MVHYIFQGPSWRRRHRFPMALKQCNNHGENKKGFACLSNPGEKLASKFDNKMFTHTWREKERKEISVDMGGKCFLPQRKKRL